MNAPQDRALFPQSLLRFLAACERLGTVQHEALSLFLSSFRLSSGLRVRIETLTLRLRNGATLAELAPQFADLFPAWLVPMLRWAQKSGQLGDALEWSAAELDREARTGRTVYTMLAYPVVLITCTLALCVYAITFVSPQFKSIFGSMGALEAGPNFFDRDWPVGSWVARTFTAMSGWDNALFAVLGIWLMGIGVALWSRAPGHKALNALLRRTLPGLATVDRHAREALAARLIGGGVDVGVSLPELLDDVAPLAGSPEHERLLRHAAARLRQGASPGEAFELAAADGPSRSFAIALGGALSGAEAGRVLARISGGIL